MLASLLMAAINADAITFTDSNVPLGITLAQFKQQHPECDAEKGRSQRGSVVEPLAGYKFEPLTGYEPPFPDLLPNYRGSYLTMFGPWGYPHMAVLGEGYFALYYIQCPDADSQSQYYAALIYQGKIAVVMKSSIGEGPADRAMARVQQSLSGRKGPLHKARTVSGSSLADVLVTYADQGNIRTVVETLPVVGAYHDEAAVQVAYIDLTLWRDYSSRVEAKLKATSEREEREAETLIHSDIPLGITLAQFQQQNPQCRAVHPNPVSGFGWGLSPLTGYVPPFPDLLPNYQGSYLTITVPYEPAKPTLGDEYFALSTIYCGDGANQSQDMALTYQGEIAIVAKADRKTGEGPVDHVIARLQQGLSGRQGPLHKARTTRPQPLADVLVTYADQGNVRTVVAAQEGPRPDDVVVYVAHIDLTLWRDYSSRVEADLKAKSEREKREATTLRHSSAPVGIKATSP